MDSARYCFTDPKIKYYKNNILEDWQVRVLNEKADLDVKISKLHAFVYSDKYKNVLFPDNVLLAKQLGFMTAYSGILADRIGWFDLEKP